jgi:hypothetical protein
MYDHFASKYGFKKPPTMVFDSDPSNQSKVLGKTAYYDPQSLEIHVFIDGRHPKDVLRSIAHELIHHRQNMEGRLDTGGYSGPGYYLENDELKEVEHEAMLEGNATMREYEDTVKYKNIKENKKMSLKEWKNNELNKQLLKKFGILKENKKPDFLDLDKDGDKEEPMASAAKSKGKKGEEKEDLEESTSGRHSDADRRQSKDREYADRLRESDNEEDEIKDKDSRNKKYNFDKKDDDAEEKENTLQEADEDINDNKKNIINQTKSLITTQNLQKEHQGQLLVQMKRKKTPFRKQLRKSQEQSVLL